MCRIEVPIRQTLYRTCPENPMIPISVLDLSPILEGATAAASFANSLDLARHAEAVVGIDISQVALWYGADDVDGTIQEYEITRKSYEETRQVLTRGQLVERIRRLFDSLELD